MACHLCAVFTARFAGIGKTNDDRMQKVLKNLKGSTNRKAQFRTVICYRTKDDTHFFEGICKGEVLTEKQEKDGFGYDPIFKPDGSESSFASMPAKKQN